MSMPLTALAAIFSLGSFPIALQTGAPPPAASESVESQAGPVIVTGEAREALLAEIASALGSVETAKGSFVQTDSNFQEVTGSFYLRRPGRVRFEYDQPSPLLIVADGATVAIEDRDLETQDRVPLGATPLALLLDDELDFETEANVLDLQRTDDLIQVTLEDRSGENEGTLALVLDASDMSLIQWRTIDPSGAVTTVQLAGIETGMRINPRLFRIEEIGAEDERD